MRWAGGIVAVVLLVAAGSGLAGEEAPEDKPVKMQEERDLGELEMTDLVEGLKADLDALVALKGEMEEALEAIERVDAEVAELREQRLEQRLDEIADLGPEMEDAIEKLRLLRKRSEELRADLRETKEAQREVFKAIEIAREDKALLKVLMSDRELPFIPPERRVVKVRQKGSEREPRLKSEWALKIRERNERRREERRRRLEQLEREDPELHKLMAEKVELLEQLDGPRAELAEHMEAIQGALRELHRRLGELYRFMEPGPDF